MSTPQRKQPLGVIDRLLEEPYRFGFFQAVRLLERWFVQQEGVQAGDVLGRRVRFRNSLLLSFPASEIAQLKLPDLNTTNLDSAIRTIEGAARSMGLEVVG